MVSRGAHERIPDVAQGGAAGLLKETALTLWFDTTDVWNWTRPHLTGIQRVVSMVLAELLKTDHDIRLFRFDPELRAIVSVALDQLPAIIHSNDSPGPAKPASANIAQSHPVGGRFLDLVYRRGPESVRSAVDNLHFAQQDLKHALNTWFTAQANPKRTKVDLDARIRDRPLFRSGDVCLSLSLTSGHEGYWEAVSLQKPSDVPYILLLHDIELVTQPQWTPPHWEGFERWLASGVDRAAILLTVSRFQQGEIRRYLGSRGLADKPVEVISLGDDPTAFGNGGGQSLSARMRNTLVRPFVLFVAGFFARKNHAGLYQTWRRLSAHLGDECPQLVLVGERPRMRLDVMSQMQRDPLTKDRISVLFDVDDEDLASLYRACLFTVYPSFYEGWGLPVSESLRFGRYCIASSAASLPEVGGDLVDYVDPFDQVALYNKVLRAIQDVDYVTGREDDIRRNYRPRSWSDTARQILACVDRVRSQPG
jgi:glycosyltransferase involved in cell wall biosynthesis